MFFIIRSTGQRRLPPYSAPTAPAAQEALKHYDAALAIWRTEQHPEAEAATPATRPWRITAAMTPNWLLLLRGRIRG